MPSKFDINPETGKQYGINPATGVQDDNYWAQVVEPSLNGGGGGGGGGGGFNIPPFNFDWTQAENEALEKLRPYYEKLLAESNGDFELAKSRLREDYETGARYRQEDLATARTEDTQLAKDETQQAREALNKRGVLFAQIPQGEDTSQAPLSPYAQTQELGPQADKQAGRKLAIERAYARQEDVAGLTRKRGLEDIGIQQPRMANRLQEEKKEKAITQMAPLKYQQEYQKYQAAINPYTQG